MIRMISDYYVIYRNIVGNKRKGATFATYTRARVLCNIAFPEQPVNRISKSLISHL